jgi:hypothetical protein
MKLSGYTKYWPVCAFAALSISPNIVNADQTAPASKINSAVISRFVSQYGVPIIVGEKPIAATDIDIAGQPPRIIQIASLSSNAGMTWRKIYRITPASDNSPVTTLFQAQEMVDNDSSVDLALIGSPAISAEKLLARADGADVSYPDGLPKADITIELSNATTSEAIAQLAAITHTHWLAAYYLAPAIAVKTYTSTRIASSDTPGISYQDFEQNYMNNGPFIIHTAPVPTQAAGTFDSTDKANQPAALTMPDNQGQASPQQGAYQQPMVPAIVNDPYGYNGLMYAPSYAIGGGSQVINPFSN